MMIEGYRFDKYEEGYYSTKDVSTDFHQDSGPLLEIERVRPGYWQARIMNGPWCENIAFQQGGPFHRVKKHMERALREEQHIYA